MGAPVVVFIVNYCSESETMALLRDLALQAEQPRVLSVVVDNSPEGRDGSVRLEEFTRKNTNVEVWRAPDNLGYYGGARWALDA